MTQLDPRTTPTLAARTEYLRLRAVGVSQGVALTLAAPAARALNAARMRALRDSQGHRQGHAV